MNWHGIIVCDPNIMMGKPVVAGTRITVEFILDLYAAGWSQEQVLLEYPALSSKTLQAVFAYSSARLKDEELISIKLGA